MTMVRYGDWWLGELLKERSRATEDQGSHLPSFRLLDRADDDYDDGT
jgi:hypothetical protein